MVDSAFSLRIVVLLKSVVPFRPEAKHVLKIEVFQRKLHEFNLFRNSSLNSPKPCVQISQ